MKTRAYLSAALLCWGVPARAANAFVGHYGYMFSYHDDYSAKPSFRGPLEVADLFPSSCQGLEKRMDCAKVGMVELYVLPKKVVAAQLGASDLDAYVAASLADGKKLGLKTRVKRGKRAGMRSALIEMPGHPQPLNTMLLIEGSKVYYRFKYNDKTGAKAALAMADSLKEIQPHDEPPPPGAR